jgi:hypothetical protein
MEAAENGRPRSFNATRRSSAEITNIVEVSVTFWKWGWPPNARNGMDKGDPNTVTKEEVRTMTYVLIIMGFAI